MTSVCSTLSLVLLCASATAYAAGAPAISSTKSLYLGIFGGGGALMNDTITQQGTAFYTEAEGGPLAVKAKGNANGDSVWLVGTHIGYAAKNIMLTKNSSAWNMTPAAELEGYYIGNSAFNTHLTNNTIRLPEHTFSANYPMHVGIFLVNAVFSFNDADGSKLHPYFGIGIGTGVASIQGAKSVQIAPAEPGINHYNSGTTDTSSTFAFQPKVGLRYDLNQHVSLFAEYRFVYLAATSYTFGSTVYDTHVPTSTWTVRMDALNYNLGLAGIRFSF